MPKRIAIVEDEAELASLIDYNLTRHGYETQVLNGSKGTLKSLEQHKPDLVVLDVMLPDIDGEPAAMEIGPFRLDRTGRRVFLAGRELALTSTEFNLLEFFVTHPGRAYSRDQLLESVWGEMRNVTPRTVDVHVRRLREQIEEQAENPRYLTTVRGFGYRFEDPA